MAGLLGDGQFYLRQSQAGLTNAASRESARNIQNKQIDIAEKNEKAQLGAAVGSTVGGVAGGALAGATAGSVVPVYGTAIGALVGTIAGVFGSKLF